MLPKSGGSVLTDVLRNKISKLNIFLHSSIMFYIRQFTRLHLDIAGLHQFWTNRRWHSQVSATITQTKSRKQYTIESLKESQIDSREPARLNPWEIMNYSMSYHKLSKIKQASWNLKFICLCSCLFFNFESIAGTTNCCRVLNKHLYFTYPRGPLWCSKDGTTQHTVEHTHTHAQQKTTGCNSVILGQGGMFTVRNTHVFADAKFCWL